jgi:hypothetical protein
MSQPILRSVTSLVLGLTLGGTTWSCAAVLGIEDASCDPAYDMDCRGAAAVPLFPSGSGGEGGDGVASAGSAGESAGGSTPVGAGGSAGNAGSSSAAEEPLCVRYCRTVAANCTEDYRQYASEDTCLAVCASLEPGAPFAATANPSGNTVECRLARAVLAARTGEPVDYCFSAGPGGGGVCGNDCEAYCDIMTDTCEELGGREDCLSACQLIPDRSAPPESLLFSTAVQAGDSLQCRLFHVSAATVDPVGHCVHAAGMAVCN